MNGAGHEIFLSTSRTNQKTIFAFSKYDIQSLHADVDRNYRIRCFSNIDECFLPSRHRQVPIVFRHRRMFQQSLSNRNWNSLHRPDQRIYLQPPHVMPESKQWDMVFNSIIYENTGTYTEMVWSEVYKIFNGKAVASKKACNVCSSSNPYLTSMWMWI